MFCLDYFVPGFESLPGWSLSFWGVGLIRQFRLRGPRELKIDKWGELFFSKLLHRVTISGSLIKKGVRRKSEASLQLCGCRRGDGDLESHVRGTCFCFIDSVAPLCSTAGSEGPCAHSVTAAVHLWEAEGTAGAPGRARLPVPHGDRGHRDRHPAAGVFTGLLRAPGMRLPPLSETRHRAQLAIRVWQPAETIKNSLVYTCKEVKTIHFYYKNEWINVNPAQLKLQTYSWKEFNFIFKRGPVFTRYRFDDTSCLVFC